jgi:serpin B
MASIFKSMGMKDAFNPHTADFSGIDEKTRPLWIDTAPHKAFLQVDEEGTEAAGATGLSSRGGDPPIATFRADHPFIFLILDKRTDSILFMGRVMEPQAE